MAGKSSKSDKGISNINDKEKALEHALDEIQKVFGKGAVMKLGDNGLNNSIEAISTGSISLDVATGNIEIRQAADVFLRMAWPRPKRKWQWRVAAI